LPLMMSPPRWRTHAGTATERYRRGCRSRCLFAGHIRAEYLAAKGDKRQIVADVHARYFGAELDDSSLMPGTIPASARPVSRTGSACRRGRRNFLPSQQPTPQPRSHVHEHDQDQGRR
jgi:hypothetical protein